MNNVIRATITITHAFNGLPSGAIHVVELGDSKGFDVVALLDREPDDHFETKNFTTFFRALDHATKLAGWSR